MTFCDKREGVRRNVIFCDKRGEGVKNFKKNLDILNGRKPDKDKQQLQSKPLREVMKRFYEVPQNQSVPSDFFLMSFC